MTRGFAFVFATLMVLAGVGQAVSSGCFRMTNEDVTDLYNRVSVGATVVVRN